MKFGYHRGYVNGYAAAIEQAKEGFERQVALLQEQLADARTLATYQSQRADAACDELLRHLGLRAISNAGLDAEDRRVRNAMSLSAVTADDPLDDHPFSTPGTIYAGENGAHEALLVQEPPE